MPNQNRDNKRRWQKELERRRKTPINVKRASTYGKGIEGRWGADSCPVCGEKVCYDISRGGGLLALNGGDRNPHRHQPPQPDRAANRSRIANGECQSKYPRYHTKG